jgi:hypothetical protein
VSVVVGLELGLLTGYVACATKISTIESMGALGNSDDRRLDYVHVIWPTSTAKSNTTTTTPVCRTVLIKEAYLFSYQVPPTPAFFS